MNSIIPEIINIPELSNLEKTFFNRLENSGYEQVFIDIDNCYIKNIAIVDYYTEMFGVPRTLVSQNLDNIKSLFDFIFTIQKSNASFEAIKKLSLFLGAENIVINKNSNISYDGSTTYNGSSYYDGGTNANRFAFSILAVNVPIEKQSQFYETFFNVFTTLIPIHIFIDSLNFITE